MKIGFIGLGNMATAMIGGIIKNKIVAPSDIIGSSKTEKSRQKAKDSFSINCVASNTECAKESDILVLSVKPQMYQDVIEEIRDSIKNDCIIVSIAPGKTINWLQEQFNADKMLKVRRRIVRCMPNTPALVLEGCTGVCKDDSVSDQDFETVIEILNGFGKAYEVTESQMDAVVAVSGSSPAYVFMMIEAMADAAVLEGIPRAKAYEFAAQAVLGSAKMVLELGKHPAELKDMVCSPAGTTIEAVKVLEEKGFRSALIDAMVACADKSKGL